MSGAAVGTGDRRDWVGPVLQAGPIADAVVAAIREVNRDVEVVDRGSYLRVLVLGRCCVRRADIEQRTQRPFRLPSDLECIMSSFKGKLRISGDEATWELQPTGRLA